jgi:PEGA domain
MVSVDGGPKQPVGAFGGQIAAGTHSLEFSADGYQNRLEVLAVRAGDEQRLTIALAAQPPPPPPPPTTGLLEVAVAAPGAVLRIDGAAKGAADGFHQQIAAGSHVVEVSADGYETRHDTVTVPAGGEKSLEIALARIPPPPPTTGLLTVAVAAPGAVLRIDGELKGAAAGFHQQVPAGNHVVEVSAEGYETRHETVAVPAGGEKTLELALSRIPPPPQTASLRLEVTPASATLVLDGSGRGSADGFRGELSPGKHEIVITAPGYQRLRQSIRAAAGKPLTLSYRLSPIIAVRRPQPQESPPPFPSPVRPVRQFEPPAPAQPPPPVAPAPVQPAPPPPAPAPPVRHFMPPP